jgi:hypothetical protein
LSGTVDANGNTDLSATKSSREALWGKPNAFSTATRVFLQIQSLSRLRKSGSPLFYRRLYLRETSGNGNGFGYLFGSGGLVAFSRILSDREILVVANTGTRGFSGAVLMDRDINAIPHQMSVACSNLGNSGTGAVRQFPTASFYRDGQISDGPALALDVVLAASEVQLLVSI